MKLPQTGGCQCGAIRYEITEALQQVLSGSTVQTTGLGMSFLCATKRLISATMVIEHQTEQDDICAYRGRTGCASDLCLSLPALCC